MQFVLLVNRIAPDYRPGAQSESPLGTASYPSFLQQSFFQATLSIINPRRACAARVTVVVLCVCVSVCLCVCVSGTILGLQATRRLMSDTNSFSATRA